MGLVSELRRRNVFRVAIAYVLIAWIILEAGDVLAPALHLPEWVVSALVFFLVLGFPLALTFAWAFELTSEGIKLEKHVDRSKSITHITGRKLDYVIIAVLAVGVVLFAFDKWVLEPSRDAELVEATTEAVTEVTPEAAEEGITPNSIAVLPFADLSPEGDQEYFSDGISEEILIALSHIPELDVISRSSSFGFKGKALNIPTVAKQLGVANVLEGSVRRSGDRVRINAQLIDGRTDKHLWSDSYDRELKDIFAVQDEISAAIVDALKVQLGLQISVQPRPTSVAHIDAHEAYLRGRFQVVQRTKAAIEGAVYEYEKAIALDPDYALAHAELAIATLLLDQNSYGDLTASQVVARASPHVELALALNPRLAETRAAKGFLFEHQGYPEEALTHYRLALEINPNYSVVYVWMANVYWDFGRYEEAFGTIATAVRLDPLSRPARANYVQHLISRNRLDEADREVEKTAIVCAMCYAIMRSRLNAVGGNLTSRIFGDLNALLIEPEKRTSRRRLSWNFAVIGLEEEALTISRPLLPIVLRILGKPKDAVTIAEARLAEDPDSIRDRYSLGMALASAGNLERAKPFLEEAWERQGGQVTNLIPGRFRTDSAAALIAARRANGESIDDLLAATKENVRRYREAGMINGDQFWDVDYEDGIAIFLTGEREQGLALIAEGVENGYFIMPSEAYLQELYDHPKFPEIRAKQDVRLGRQRDRFLSIVCTENPYQNIWQPAERTCERFAARGGN